MDSVAGSSLNETLAGLLQRLSPAFGGLCAQGQSRRARAVPIMAVLPVELQSHFAAARTQGRICSAHPLDRTLAASMVF